MKSKKARCEQRAILVFAKRIIRRLKNRLRLVLEQQEL